MTLATRVVDRPPLPSFARSPARVTTAASRLDVAALGVALAGFLYFVLPDGYSVTGTQMQVAVLTIVPAIWRARPWQSLARPALAIVAGCVAGAAVVLVRTDWAGAFLAFYMIYGLLVYVVVVGYSATSRRRTQILCTAFAIAVAEFAAGWHGSLVAGDPSAPMTGSIHGHNQFATFLLGPGLAAAVLYLRRPHPRLQVLYAATVVATGAGIVLSTSRAALGLYVLGWLATGLLILAASQRRQAALRWLSIPVLLVAAVAILTQPAFFGGHHYSWPLIGHGGRGTATMAANNDARFQYMGADLQVWTHHPLVGAGFGSFGTVGAHYLPAGLRSIDMSYDAWVDALGSGGLVYGVPMLALGVGLVGLLGRGLRRAWPDASSGGTVILSCVIGVSAMLAHIAYDADTYFPQVIAMAAVLVGVLHAAVRDHRAGLADAARAARLPSTDSERTASRSFAAHPTRTVPGPRRPHPPAAVPAGRDAG